MRKTWSVLALLVALALVLPSAGTAGMWVGGQLGGAFFANQDITVSAGGESVDVRNVKFQPSVIGGLQIGYYFVKEGFLGCNYPDWMKYFFFATDFTYNRLVTREKVIETDIGTVETSITNGYMATWSFLFGARYGFFPDSDVPFGRLQPYVAVGPAILFSGIRFGVNGQQVMQPPPALEGQPFEFNSAGGNGSSVDIALVAEGGVRYFALKCVSIDAAFRYLLARPEYSFRAGGESVDIKVPIDMFSFLIRANYHF